MNDLRWRRFLISNPSDWPVTFKGLLLVKETPLFVICPPVMSGLYQ